LEGRIDSEVIVVGAGPAGSACAISLARKGVDVLLLEKARIPGERNVTGGVLYGEYLKGYGLVDLVPEFEKEAPLQRKVSRHDLYVLSNQSSTGQYKYYKMTKDSLPSRMGLFNLDFGTDHDYTVLKRDFDRWLALKAAEEGAMLATSTTVEDLILEDGRVVGVRTTHEDLRSKLVVDCSGVTSTLVDRASLRKPLRPFQVYHGIKHVYKMTGEVIEKRFGLKPGEGEARFYLGDFMKGISGGAFLYTNKDTISIGLVLTLSSFVKGATTKFDRVGKPLNILEDFERHPMLAELLESAELVEYSAHNIPRSHTCILETPYMPGLLVAGDALGSFVKIGALIDGMRRAIASGIMASETYIHANEKGNFGLTELEDYRERLSPIYGDVNRASSDSQISESSLAYRYLPRLLFSTGLLCKTGTAKVVHIVERSDSIQQVQLRTGLLQYDEDENYSHIKVDEEKCSRAAMKPWVPACPVNCYTLLTKKGVFASFHDLYIYNKKSLGGDPDSSEFDRAAYNQTLRDIAEGSLRFDHVACVACGTCGVIGPKDMVEFGHERDGHGVRYRYG
jgi:electron transfer flavoprotein-quinone oxidoreductase